MTMNLINLTPHEIKIVRADGTVVMAIEPSGIVARCEETVLRERQWGGFPIFTMDYGEVTGLPDQDDADCPFCGQIGGVSQFDSSCAEHGEAIGTARTFIVSGQVRKALPHRRDLVSPGKQVRDAKGQPIGCLGLIENAM